MAGRGSEPSAVLVSQEEAHRRILLLAIAALIVLSIGPVFGHHFAAGLEQSIHGQDHLGALCLIALHQLLRPLHQLFHALIVSGVAFATYDRVRAVRRARRILGSLESRRPESGDPFWLAATAVRLDPALVRIVPGLPNPAFTIGMLRPRVYVAEGLASELSPDELRALLAHEGAHVARRDPLRLSGLRFFALVLFWIPALRRLADDVADEAEIQADDVAARDRPLALASALLVLGRRDHDSRSARDVVGFSHRAGLLQRRIRRLAGESPPFESRVTRRSIGGAALALLVVIASGAVMVHPLPVDAAGHLPHCEHPHRFAVTHLFCLPPSVRASGEVCPHQRVAVAPRRLLDGSTYRSTRS